ncbi:MAG: hypothetical protein HUN04_10535 [Desulfobacter sp.]|nr:MAG: hypothetical protein HUN04_10535 [Desulfobacter sp.]
MQSINHKCIIPSAAFTITPSQVKYFCNAPRQPENGDLIYGEVLSMGQHRTLESKSARIHTIQEGIRAVFVMGNRYAPDYYESFVPRSLGSTVDLVARSGLVGEVTTLNSKIAAPTRIKVLGYVCDSRGNVVNTRDYVSLVPRKKEVTSKRRSKLILCVGTAMNSGKSHAAAACCYALSSARKKVRAAKVTGTASLKDLLLMEDCGAERVADFTCLGYPTTYMLEHGELTGIFNAIDLKYGNNPANYLVVEFADGILQRETRMLLNSEAIQSRIHRLVFCGNDAFGVLGGIRILKEEFGLVPDALSGVCTSSPLHLRECAEFVALPVLRSAETDYQSIYEIIR